MFVAGIAFGEKNTAYGATIGYGIKGRVDVRLALATASGSDGGTGYSLTLEAHPMRSSPEQQVGFSLGASGETDSYSMPASNSDVTIMSAALFGRVNYQIMLSDGAWLLPMYEIRWISRIKDSDRPWMIFPDVHPSTLLHSFGLMAVLAGTGKTRYFLSPGIAASSEGRSVSVEAGVVF
jgi:hypothetical protein